MIASDLPAHRETLGSAAALFQPGDAAGLAAAIRSAAGNRELAERGRAAVAELSWDATAQALEQVLAEAAR